MELATRSLTELESVIERGLTTFVDVGTALAEIRDRRLYKESHSSFDAYCLFRWKFGRDRAIQIIEAAIITKELDDKSPTFVGIPLPERETQVRELARVEPEHRAEIWAAVVEEHGPKATADEVKQVAQDRGHFRPDPKPPTRPSNIRAMPSFAERLPEETVMEVTSGLYAAQVGSILNQVVSKACDLVRFAARDAQKMLDQEIDWTYIKPEMKESKSITDAIRVMDEALLRFTQRVRPEVIELRRVK